jgi:recombinational DNA repair protein (RecF pathway)
VRNTSLILGCYTERSGMVSVFAKGAFRRRSRAEPASVPDLFARGEVVLSVHPRREYAILREWSLEDIRRGVRTDYDAFRAASGCAGLAEAVSWRGGLSAAAQAGGNGELYGLLDSALGELDRGGAARPLLWAFVLKAMAKAGFLSGPAACAVCGSAFGSPGSTRLPAAMRHAAQAGRGAGGGEAASLAPGSGGFVCAECARRLAEEGRESHEKEPVLPLPPEAAASARFLASAPLAAAARLSVSARAAAPLERAVRSLAEYHLERPMPVLSRE